MYLIAIMVVIIAAVVAIDRHFKIVRLKPLLVSSALILLTTLTLAGCSDEETDSNNSATDKTEQISKKDYNQAKKEHQQLVATNEQLDKELAETEQQRKELEQKEDAQESTVADEANSDQTQSTNNDTNSSNDDTIQGGDSQYIIGNVNSHVYHMPGQRGYSMKSKNAVYFSSEQEAINAGYRKAKQ
ncbi:hypothetical protein [Companilactobacillus furfuricola]|uniref:sunset domain-containing protein n=1 Tax=Companilactobacillus furfuricola TaxID=1462575 RepID=UPI000F767BF2|nr:hypothetical protein [Companilactobacillus furfuricola]